MRTRLDLEAVGEVVSSPGAATLPRRGWWPGPSAPGRSARRRRPSCPLATFLSSVQGDRLYGLWRLAATTGVRRGELLGLRWVDAELERATVRIVRAYVRGAAGLHYGEPKTASGRRMIALDPGTVGVLRSHRARQAQERLAWGADYQGGDLLFARENGAPLDPDSVTGFFERIVRGLGLPRIRLHNLRHTHATLALSAGIHPRVVMERLGHSSIAMTLDLYSDSIPAMQAAAADRIAALIDATA
ncbi:MAG: site-specific integrase [Candidatus Limnocylindria bacterium]